ncbi:MAG: hypothetical protein Q8P45_01805 [Candidatus Harrisonbacteria bacterium]|nr:hypothetical protein [Candidatus Harrisonbacteria bacterium]
MRRFVILILILSAGALIPASVKAGDSATAEQVLSAFEVQDFGDGFCVVESKHHYFEEPIDVLNAEIFRKCLRAWFTQPENQNKQWLQFVPVVRSCYVGGGKKVKARMGVIYGDKEKVKIERRRTILVENKTTKALAVVLYPSGIFPRLIGPGKKLSVHIDDILGFDGPQMLYVLYQTDPTMGEHPKGGFYRRPNGAFYRPTVEVPQKLLITEELMSKQGGLPCACRGCCQQY